MADRNFIGDLEPCPFCRSVDRLSVKPFGEAGRLAVTCREGGTIGRYGRSDPGEPMAAREAAANWNRRPAPRPEPRRDQVSIDPTEFCAGCRKTVTIRCHNAGYPPWWRCEDCDLLQPTLGRTST